MKFFSKIIICVSIVVISLCLMNYDDTKDFETAKNLDIFYSLFTEVSNNYVDELAPGDVMGRTIEELLKTLDPYTNFIPESDVERYTVMSTGEYGGIGASVCERDSSLMIMDIRKNSPAQKAGLLLGDMIVEVDGHSIVGEPTEESKNLLQGQAGTTLHLTISRRGERKQFDIEREKIKIKSIPYFGMLQNNIGYIKLNEFTQDCALDVYKACSSLKQSGAKGFILDLQDNPGGLLVEAVKIVNLFVPQGEKIVFTRGQNKANNSKFSTPSEPFDLQIPLVVLVNERSASASEIVSGALQDLDRAVIVGTKTFGKGLVQVRKELSHNCLLKITTSKYYIPSGRCIQRLDYAHRDADGNPMSVPDSLQKTFYTRNHRPVKDGGGIIPDVILSQDSTSAFLRSLKENFVFFDYINSHYSYKDTTTIKPHSFEFSNSDYQNFVEYCKHQNYRYNSQSEKLLNDFETEVTKESLNVQSQIEQLKNQINAQQEMLFELDKELIKKELSSFIVRNLYAEEGQTEFLTRNNSFIDEAMKYLLDTTKYNKILKK